jgi:hypothetical protein
LYRVTAPNRSLPKPSMIENKNLEIFNPNRKLF